MINIEIPSGVKNVKDKAAEKNEQVEKFLEHIDSTVSEKSSEILSSIGKSLEPMASTLKFASGVLTKLQVISNLIPIDMTSIPSFNLESIFTGGILNSIKQIALAAWLKLKDEANKLKIHVINMGFDALDNLVSSITDSIKSQLIDYIDKACKEYTGYSYLDVVYLCANGFHLINELKDILKEQQEKPHLLSKKESKTVKQQLSEYRNRGKKNLEDTISNQKEEVLQSAENIKDNMAVSINAKKQEILAYAKRLSDPLFNAFSLIVLKNAGEELLEKLSIITTTFNTQSLNDVMNCVAIICDFFSTDMNFENAAPVDGYSLNEQVRSLTEYQARNKDEFNNIISISILDKNSGSLKITMFFDPSEGYVQTKMIAKLKELKLFDNATINNILNESKNFYSSGNPSTVTHISEVNNLPYSITFEKRESDEEPAYEVTTDTLSVLESTEILMNLNSPKPVSFVLQNALKILLKLLPSINPIATLISNYRTNKEYVRQFAMKNCDILTKEAKRTSSGAEEIDLQDRNAYIIRTDDMFDIFCMVLNKEILNENDILTKEETNEIYDFLKLHGYQTHPLRKERETKIYIHLDGGKDGSFVGTKFTYYPLLGTMLISHSGKDENPSQIMRCIRNGYAN